MKQAILNLKKKLLLVELPTEIIGDDVSINNTRFHHPEFKYPDSEFRGLHNYNNIILPSGNRYKSIGKLTDITEEQFVEYVEKEFDTFRDYTQEDSVGPFVVNTAKESLFSKLESDEIYFEPKNTLDKPNINDYDFGHGHNESELYNKHLKSWEDGQEKVWDKGRTWLFEII